MRSAFGVDHGDISKVAPYPGGQWGSNATPEAKKKHRKKLAAGMVGVGVGGGLMGGADRGLKGRTGKVGAGLAAAGGAYAVGSNYHGTKTGVIADPYRRKS